MRINSLTINGFQAPGRHAEVHFSKGNVTVIYGDNGCGKTTFLKVIQLFLSQDEQALSALGIKSIECVVVGDDGQES
jgi:predicted ATP-binding protein involved in virulence